MIAIRRLLAAVAFVSSTATPGLAQVYWQNNSSAGITDDILSVTYANGTFAATTAQGNVMTSIDGLTWESQSVSPGTPLMSITYGDDNLDSNYFGKFPWVAVGARGSIFVSADLNTWTKASSPTANTLNCIIWISTLVGIPGPTSFYAALGDNGTILTSHDAQDWMIVPSGVTANLYGATRSEFYWYACGQGGGLLLGGIPSAQIASGTPNDLESILYVYPQNSVAVGANGTIIYHEDAPPSMVGDQGLGWSNATVPSMSATLRGLAYGNGSFVAAGDQGTILTSIDGVTWTRRFSGDSPSTLCTATLRGATFSTTLQRFVVVGDSGTILVSNAPQTVFANVSTRGDVSSIRNLIGGFVIEGSAPRTVLIRADGPALSSFGVPSALPDPVLTVYNGQNVMATNTGWTTNPTPALISAAATRVGAFALPNPSKDSAVLLTLQPGAYTVVITSAGGNSGTALFEAYTY